MQKFMNELIFYSMVALARRVVIPDDDLASKMEKVCGPGCRCCNCKNSRSVIHDGILELKLMILRMTGRN